MFILKDIKSISYLIKNNKSKKGTTTPLLSASAKLRKKVP